MASAGEMKLQGQHSILKAGEAYAALETAKEHIAAAVEALYEAGQTAAMTADQSEHHSAVAALQLYMEAESHARAMYAQLEQAQSAAAGANEATEMYVGGL